MAKKIYFSPSNQEDNRYAVGNTTEDKQCDRIALACVKVAERCGFNAKTNTNASMSAKVSESNSWGADVHIPIHTNAHNKTTMGTRIFCYKLFGTGYKISKEIMATLAPITPGASDDISKADFYEIMYANAPTVYIEVAFHDTKKEAQWIIDHTDEIAEEIVRGLCNYYGVKFVGSSSSSKPTTKPSTSIKALYRVRRIWKDANGQLGAFESLSRAKKVADKNPGYSVYGTNGKLVYTGKKTVVKKTITEIAKEVIDGKWGNGDSRIKKLTKAGYSPDAVQKKVNELLNPTKKKSITTVAKEVILGKWGNGQARIDKLRKAGYDPDAVQKKVNELL